MTPRAERAFILSTGRTATVFLSQMLQAMLGENAVVHHEGNGKDRIINTFANMHFSGIVSQQFFENYLRRHLERNVPKTPQYYIDASLYMYGAPSIAPDVFEDDKIIHIIRDPRKFVTSVINFLYTKPKSYLAHKFLPFWQPPQTKTYFKESFFNNPYREFDQYCWAWDFRNACIENSLENAQAAMTIKFEELIDKEHAAEIHRQMLGFIGYEGEPLPVKLEKLKRNVSQAKKIDHWEMWDDVLCYRLHVVCGARMVQYGYGNEALWMDKVEKGAEAYSRKK